MKKILIVDDEPLLVKSMCIVLKYRGFDVQGVMDGYEGIKSAESFQPDIIILDIMMPGIDGWETLKRLKENDKTRHIPVIIFTAKEYSNGTQLARQAGAADLITKPVEPEILISSLTKLSD
ncbi:MAG TPA: response regulator [Chitinispirillaceae bacterium]|nr:response regulator [Chitinispirillaceae bacterium]